MSTVSEIETAVKRLPPADYEAFIAWLDKFDERRWDAQIERDISLGRFDSLASKAVEDYKAGKCSRL